MFPLFVYAFFCAPLLPRFLLVKADWLRRGTETPNKFSHLFRSFCCCCCCCYSFQTSRWCLDIEAYNTFVEPRVYHELFTSCFFCVRALLLLPPTLLPLLWRNIISSIAFSAHVERLLSFIVLFCWCCIVVPIGTRFGVLQ